MAAIARSPNGRYRVRFTDPSRVRRSISTGTDSAAAARLSWGVEQLMQQGATGWSAELAEWVASIPDPLFDRLVDMRLLPAPAGRRGRVASQPGWIRAVSLKPAGRARTTSDSFPCPCSSRNPNCYRCEGTGYVRSCELAFGAFSKNSSSPSRRRSRRLRDTACPICGRRVRGRVGLEDHMKTNH